MRKWISAVAAAITVVVFSVGGVAQYVDSSAGHPGTVAGVYLASGHAYGYGHGSGGVDLGRGKILWY